MNFVYCLWASLFFLGSLIIFSNPIVSNQTAKEAQSQTQ